jgi:hypothetical protein
MELFLAGSLVVALILGCYLGRSINRLYWSTRATIREHRRMGEDSDEVRRSP